MPWTVDVVWYLGLVYPIPCWVVPKLRVLMKLARKRV
jgi:hypothetical protein